MKTDVLSTRPNLDYLIDIYGNERKELEIGSDGKDEVCVLERGDFFSSGELLRYFRNDYYKGKYNLYSEESGIFLGWNDFGYMEYIPATALPQDRIPKPPYTLYSACNGLVSSIKSEGIDGVDWVSKLKVGDQFVCILANVVEWLVEEGEHVSVGQPLIKYFSHQEDSALRLFLKREEEESINATEQQALEDLEHEISEKEKELILIERKVDSAKKELFALDKKKKLVSRDFEKCKKEGAEIIKEASNKAKEVLSSAEKDSESIKEQAKEKAQLFELEAQNVLNNIKEQLDQPDLGFHVEAFLSRLSEVDEMAVNDQEAMYRLYMEMKNALGRVQGVEPQELNDLDEHVLTSLKVNSLYRNYSNQIKAIKEDPELDEEVKTAQLKAMKQTMTRQAQRLSGALEADF